MRFKSDEHIHAEIAAMLRGHGHDAHTVWDQYLNGAADPTLADACRREQRALLTLDTDFADIRAYPPHEYEGIVVFRLALQSRRAVLWACERILPLITTEPLKGHLWIVDEVSVRIRGD